MSSSRLMERLVDFKMAVLRLNEALNTEPTNPLLYDAAIKRFEFTYEMAWKLLKVYLSYQGIAEAATPRETFKEAFAAGLITDGELWMDMIKDRNLTSHTYDEDEAVRIFTAIRRHYMTMFENLLKAVNRGIDQ
ncbi:MAG: nucleotidyltransferase substrate binding protein [Chitinophagales bacterium]